MVRTFLATVLTVAAVADLGYVAPIVLESRATAQNQDDEDDSDYPDCTEVVITVPCGTMVVTCTVIIVPRVNPMTGQPEGFRALCSEDSCNYESTDNCTGGAAVSLCQGVRPGESPSTKNCVYGQRACGVRVDGRGACTLNAPPDPEDIDNYSCNCFIYAVTSEACEVTNATSGDDCGIARSRSVLRQVGVLLAKLSYWN